MQFLYKSTKATPIYSPPKRTKICTYEQQFYNHKKYDDYCILSYPQGCKNATCASCTAPALSIGALFYGANIVDYAAATPQEKFGIDAMSAYYYDYNHNSRVYSISSMFQLTRLAFNFSKCELMEEWKVKAVREWLYDQAGKDTIRFPNDVAPAVSGKQLYGYFIEKETLSRTPKATSLHDRFCNLGVPSGIHRCK